MNYPIPNPRVISTNTEKPLEFYFEQISAELVEQFSLPVQREAYSWVVDYSSRNNNYLPTKEVKIFSSKRELVSFLNLLAKNLDVNKNLLSQLIEILPDSSWYVHPTYPISLANIPGGFSGYQ